ncbi:MAG: hypothetical protein WCZ17_03355 [Candidatus Kapaibacterium sp.]
MKKENNLLSFVLLPYLFLVIIHILLSLPMKVPIIWPDEFAYLFFAKYMAGFEHIQQIPRIELTGSFGYSVLLAPIMMLFSDPQKAYSSVLIANGIIGSSLYIGLFLLLKNLFSAPNKQAMWISFIVSLYPAYLLQTDVALTDAVTPAFFVFGVVLFHLFVKNRTLGYGLAFAIVAGYLNWIHIRMLPFTVMSVFFLVSLVYYKRMPIFQAGLSIVIMIIMILLGIIIGDHLTYMISGEIEKSQRITVSLIQVAEVLFIFMMLAVSTYFILRKYYLLMLFTCGGLLGGVLASTTFSALWIFPVAGISFLILLIVGKKVQFRYASLAFGIMVLVAAFTFFVLPDFGYYTVVTERIMIWFVNASGSLFYALFSTYSLFLIGMIYMIFHIWNNSLIEVPAVSHTDLFKEEKKSVFSFSKLLENEVSLTLLFFLSASFLMIFITIFPTKLQVTHYRADHLFYGRYVEVVIAGFMAIGIYKLLSSDAKDFIISTLGSWLIFILLSITMIITYDNIIPSELSFRSVLSFFPLRAVLGNINVMLFFLASLIVSVVASFAFRYNPNWGKFILGLAFLSFTAFTYIYVDYYHQVEKVQRNKLMGFINENFPELDSISYDRRIFTETSQNGLSYVWLMPDKRFTFFTSKSSKPASDFVIAGSSFGNTYNNKAVFLNIEHDGNDHLWVRDGKLADSLRKTMMPSFFDIPLNKKWVGGVTRTGFHNDKWINGKVEIITGVDKPDSIFTLEIEIASSSVKPHNLIVWLDNKELFNQNIQNGGWRYTLDIKTDSIMDKLHFKFFSDLSRDKSKNNRLVGIVINSVVLKSRNSSSENDEILYTNESKPTNTDEIEYSVYPRRNIDFSQLDMTPGDTIELPMVIKNHKSVPLVFDPENPIYLSYRWRDFIFKKTRYSHIVDKDITGIIAPKSEKEVIVKLIVPSEDNKFFLDFDLLSKNQVIIIPKEKREYLMNLKYGTF